MRRPKNVLIGISLATVLACCPVFAQDDYEKINSNLAMSISAPLNPTAQYVQLGWGSTGGAGYNFNSHHSTIVEFGWNRVYPTNGVLQPLRAAAQIQDITGRSDLYSLTGNYRFELRGREFGTYFIGGGGLYHRTTNLSKPVASGTSTTCTPPWIWWGFTCESGIVTSDQQIASASSTALGANAGIGFTARVGEAPYRLYVESRYHYAPTKNVSTQLLVISFGIRY